MIADALTSVLAIVALTTGKYFGWVWMDPIMGIVGSLVIIRWSYGLLRDTSAILLDPEYGLPALKDKAVQTGLLLAYQAYSALMSAWNDASTAGGLEGATGDGFTGWSETGGIGSLFGGGK